MVWPCFSFIVLYFNLAFKAVLVLESAYQPPKGWAAWLYSVTLSQPKNTSLCLWAIVTQLPAQVQCKLDFLLIQGGKNAQEYSGNHTEVSQDDHSALKKNAIFCKSSWKRLSQQEFILGKILKLIPLV